MSTTETALTIHLVKPDPADDDAFIADVRRELHDRFGIEHVTLQFERDESYLQCANGCEVNYQP
jgi:cobalt-zinc-cadmium efflux system protein